MLGSGADEGVVGVDRSLGRERPQQWLVSGAMVTGLRLGPCDDVVWRESGSRNSNNGIF